MQIWKDLLKQQEKLLGKETVEKWLRSLKILRFDACNLYLEAKDSFHIHWFEEHIRPKIKDLKNNNAHKIHIHLQTPHQSIKEKKNKKFLVNQDPIRVDAEFSSYYPSTKNLLHYQCLASLAGLDLEKKTIFSPEENSFNPIYLYGPSGCGKSHLLMSMVHVFKARNLNVFYVGANSFTNHVIFSMKLAKMQAFREAYRNTDVLILEDVQYLSNRSATQEEFFHTFNALHTTGKQIILSAQLPPQKLQGIEPRLISRFEWGITLEIEKSEKTDLKEILKNKSKERAFFLDELSLDFLLDSFFKNPKKLFGAFDTLYLKSQQQKIDLSTVKKILHHEIKEEKKAAITSSRILEWVCNHFEISKDDIIGKGQSKAIAFPRKIAMYLCRKLLNIPFTKIGEIFGGRDHSTVITAINQIEKGFKENKREIVSAIEKITDLPEKEFSGKSNRIKS